MVGDEKPLPYVCRVCGWQFTTIDGLWVHIPSHHLDQAMYGTLFGADRSSPPHPPHRMASSMTDDERLTPEHEVEIRSGVNFASQEDIADLGREIDALRAERDAIRTAFILHRTATHEVAPTFCKTCQESDAVLAGASGGGGDTSG